VSAPGHLPRSIDSIRLLAGLLTLIFFAILIRTAWISDDALITWRTVLNVTHGYGLTFNIAERVQTFTHPLWMLLMTATYLVVRNVYAATFALSIAMSLVVFWMAIRRAASPAQMWIVAAALLFSRAFVDFSTSGLENPLSNLLLALFALAAMRAAASPSPPLLRLWLITSLLYLTRPDDVVLVAPALAAVTWRSGRSRASLRAIAIGLSPAIVWTLFALIYYGSPVPNTAAAKLATGIPRAELWQQGLLYLIDSFDRDPLTLVTIFLAIGTGFATRGPARLLALGLALYLFYVVSIGGDFMAGRFLATPVFAAALILGWIVTVDARVGYVAAASLAVVGLASAQIPLLSDGRFKEPGIRSTGIVDERAIYFGSHSLMRATRQSFADPDWPRRGESPAPPQLDEACGLLGAAGLGRGPHTHLLDDCALADPLLARLPAMFNTHWRPGHFRRLTPPGYRESLESAANLLTDPALKRLYDDVRLVTRSPLVSRDRLRAIWRLNTGRSAKDIDYRFYRHGGRLVGIESLSAVMAPETAWDAPGTRVLAMPLAIACEDRTGRRFMDVSVDSNDGYLFVFVRRNRVVAQLDIGPVPQYRRRPGLATYTVDVPLNAMRRGFDTIVVAGTGGDELYSIGHLLLDGYPSTQAELDRRVRDRDAPAPK
jgi:arabinofuranosyltransferase